MRPAVFLDRDGTVLEEAGYLDRLERLAFFPFAIDAVRLLNRGGFAVVVITNQSGVGRGMYEEAFVHEAHGVVDERVTAGGGHIDGFYYCPHHPDAGCDCRKPKTALLRRLEHDLSCSLIGVPFVGDRFSDIDAAEAVGARAMLVRTGTGAATERALGKRPVDVFDDLSAAARAILAEG